MNESTRGQLNTRKYMGFVTTTLILSLLVLSGFALRLINLGEPGFGTDEPLHVFSAQSILETGEPNLPSGNSYKRGLLFTKLVALSFRFLGINEFAARFPSVVFGTLTILLIFFAGKTFFGTPTGVISALLFTFSPIAIVWARECRMYSMFQFFFLFGALAFYNGFENPQLDNISKTDPSISWRSPWKFIAGIKGWGLSLKWLIIAGVLFYISFTLQALTALFGVSLLCYFSLMVLLSSSKRDSLGAIRYKYIFFLIILILFGLFGLLMSPKLINFIKDTFLFAPGWSRGLRFNPIYYLTFLGSTAVFPIGVFFIIGSIQIIIRNHKPGLYTLICTAAPLIIISLIPSNVRGTRYIVNIFPIVILIAGYSMILLLKSESKMLSNLLKRNQMSRWEPIISGSLLFASLLVVSAPWLHYNYRITMDYYHKEAQLGTRHRNWRDACKYVRESRKPDDIIITSETLSVLFYDCGNINYRLSKGTGFSNFNLRGMEKISDLYSLRKVISENPRGWIIIDADRFNSRRYIQKNIRDFMTQNLPSIATEPHGTVLVFNWDKSDGQNLHSF